MNTLIRFVILVVIGATLLNLSNSKIARMPKARKILHKKSAENSTLPDLTFWSDMTREASNVISPDNRVEPFASEDQQERGHNHAPLSEASETTAGEATTPKKQEDGAHKGLVADRMAGAQSCVAFCLEEGRSDDTHAESCESAVCDTLAQLFREHGLKPPVERCYRVCQLQAREACRRYCHSFFGIAY